MKIQIKLLFLIAVCALTSACSKTVNGEVFVRTQGGQTVPLSLVKVDFMDYDQAWGAITKVLDRDPQNYQAYFDAMPPSEFSATTDSQGRFTVSLPRKSLLAVAQTERRVGSKTEKLYWAVPLYSKEDKITLANDNLPGGRHSCIPEVFEVDDQK